MQMLIAGKKPRQAAAVKKPWLERGGSAPERADSPACVGDYGG